MWRKNPCNLNQASLFIWVNLVKLRAIDGYLLFKISLMCLEKSLYRNSIVFTAHPRGIML